MSDVILALIGVLLGISIAAPPGPVTAILVRKASLSATAGIFVGLGAMSADFILMVLTFSIKALLIGSLIIPAIYAAGSLFFGILAYQAAFSGDPEKVFADKSYPTGLAMGLTNPFQIGWWITAGLAFNQKFGLFPFYFLFIGIFIWVLFISYAVRLSVLRYGRTMKRILRIFSSLTLGTFSALFLYYFIGYVLVP